MFLAGVFLLQSQVSFAQEAPTAETNASSLSQLASDSDVLWTCLAAFMVFFMQAGFALVECGFTRAKSACNIIMKNLMDFSIGSLGFWLVGFGLMFGTYKVCLGTSGFAFDADSPDAIVDGSFGWAFLLFQTVFAATAATIVSGAMAERTKFVAYLAYSVAITVVVYPVFGSWAWNGLVSETGSGWLEGFGFIDFAGSTVVHSVGGWAALAGAIVIGARKGKYRNGKPQPIPGHNIPLAALGVFILWLGWFGFNAGSTTAIGDGEFAKVAVVTNLAAAAGAAVAMIVSWVMFKKPDVGFALNGALAGLVAITAGCYNMGPAAAVLTGAIGGGLCVMSVVLIDRLGVDDPVGAVSVHGVCGAWGTLAIGLWGVDHATLQGIGLLNGGGVGTLGVQALGVGAAFLWAFPVSFVIFLGIKHTIGLRVTEEEELRGLDVTEHGMQAYPSPTFGEAIGAALPGVVSASASTPATSSPIPTAGNV